MMNVNVCISRLRPFTSTVLKRGSSYSKCTTRCLSLGTERGGCISSKQENKKLKITPAPHKGGLSDSIGPPDPISNIRPIQFYIPSNEGLTEKHFRLKREEVLEWNKKFWTEHNSRFFQGKEKYIEDHQLKDTDGNAQQLSPEEMSKFYKKFLNENWNAHLQYNKDWYKKNITLLWPAFKVAIIRLRRKLQRKS